MVGRARKVVTRPLANGLWLDQCTSLRLPGKYMLSSDTPILVLGNDPKGVCRLLRWAGYRNPRTGSILASPPQKLAEGANPFEHSGDLSLKLALHFKPDLVILNHIPLQVIWDIIRQLKEHDETKGGQIIVATPGLT